MEILVCGATGHIGRHLVDQLLADGHQVRALTRTPHSADLPPAAPRVRGDLTDASTLQRRSPVSTPSTSSPSPETRGADLTTGPEIVGPRPAMRNRPRHRPGRLVPDKRKTRCRAVVLPGPASNPSRSCSIPWTGSMKSGNTAPFPLSLSGPVPWSTKPISRRSHCPP